MSTAKIYLLLFVSTAMLLGITACESEKNTDSAGENSYNITEETSFADTEAAVTEVFPVMPAQIYDGRGFNIAVPNDNGLLETIYTEAEDGDVVNDAIYKRNLNVEENLGVKLNFIDVGTGSGQIGPKIIANIAAGDSCWDMSIGNGMWFVGSLINGAYANYHDIPHFEYNKPWWNERAVNHCTLLGKLYLFYPAVTSSVLGDVKVLTVNSKIMSNYNIEMPYDIVKNGDWTFDELNKLTKGVYQDLNGDGQRDKNDLFGFVCSDQADEWVSAFESEVIAERDGSLVIEFNQNRLSSIIDKMYSYYFETPEVFVTDKGYNFDGEVAVTWVYNKFMNEQSMMCVSTISSIASKLRYTDIEYNIMPFPKWDENQENYGTAVGWGSAVVFPANNPDFDFTGYVFNCMCYETYKQIIPAYYDLAVKEKILLREEDKEMLEIAFDNSLIINSSQYGNYTVIQGVITPMMMAKDRDFASWYAKNESSAKNSLEKLNEFFKSK